MVSEEVEHALETGSSGVVALETAIVTHGQSVCSQAAFLY